MIDPASSSFFADYPYAVHPPTDDRPFFFHFFKWRQIPQILASLGKSWQPFGGSGYLVLVLLLGLLTVLSVVLILLPLVLGSHRNPTDDTVTQLRLKPGTVLGYLVFFSCLGLGFLLVEISLIQRFIAYLGQPAYAFATVLGGLLLASGLGSRYLSRRIPLTLGLLGIASLSLAYPVLLDPVFDARLLFAPDGSYHCQYRDTDALGSVDGNAVSPGTGAGSFVCSRAFAVGLGSQRLCIRFGCGFGFYVGY